MGIFSNATAFDPDIGKFQTKSSCVKIVPAPDFLVHSLVILVSHTRAETFLLRFFWRPVLADIGLLWREWPWMNFLSHVWNEKLSKFEYSLNLDNS